MIIGKGCRGGIRQRYIPDHNIWLFESPVALDQSSLDAAAQNAKKVMEDRRRSLPANADPERRMNLNAAINAINNKKYINAVVGESTHEFTIFKSTERIVPSRSFFL